MSNFFSTFTNYLKENVMPGFTTEETPVDKPANPFSNYISKSKMDLKPNVEQEEEFIMPNKFNIDTFVEKMGQVEGVEDHMAQEGNFTYGYGVLPSTARQYGVKYDDNADRKEMATQVYEKMYQDFKKENPEIPFDTFDQDTQVAVMSLFINLGSLSKAQTIKAKLAEGDVKSAAESLLMYNNLTKNGEKFSSKGLVKRRAIERNQVLKAMGADESELATKVEVEGTREAPVFVLLNAKGEEVTRIDGKNPLDSGNSFKSVAVPSTTRIA